MHVEDMRCVRSLDHIVTHRNEMVFTEPLELVSNMIHTNYMPHKHNEEKSSLHIDTLA